MVTEMIVSQLYLYPVKSLGGISVSSARMDGKGFRYDRRFMLITPDGRAMTQHKHPQMALIDVSIDGPESPGALLRVWHRHHPDNVLTIPLNGPEGSPGPAIPVTIWEDRDVSAVLVSSEADCWFSAVLEVPCRLVFMPPTTHRPVDPAYARHGESIGFTDGYPYLIIGQASLDDLNQRLTHPVDMRRFRPNVVISGGQPYAENDWPGLQIGDYAFYRGSPCGRCMLIDIDPVTGQRGQEPLKTLATYRNQNGLIVFGQYVLAEPPPEPMSGLSAGDERLADTGIIWVGQAAAMIEQGEAISCLP